MKCHVASSEGRADVVKYLLAHDARPKKQPSPAAMPSFYQHQAGGNHQPPDRQQSMDNCKCTIC